jgi:hypothetical protein
MRNAPLRFRLLVVAIVAIVPVACVSIASLFKIAEARRGELERSAIETVLALSIARVSSF